ncbi:flagellin N-terminal helical domain-containing protein [Pseudoduganella aquatica]|uniref:Flagellin n=1 Tax=Pseudoduganella aquatica TaxID=2660641 RepID=A0A7X4KJY7_9BURK|nr:flagellin [Pseudoduganella aquatica]MYN06579.1 flagellin [Pseudoduganella aquatica]
MQINSNLASLNAQHSLQRAASAVGGSMERLSSGQRVNSAKDDAAGLAITQRMTATIRGMQRAAQNANDSISMLQVAQGAAGQVSENFQRIRELAVQAANGTYGIGDRQALQGEVDTLMKANYQILDQSTFNGHKLLDGNFREQLQVGAHAGQALSLALPAVLPVGLTMVRPAEVPVLQLNAVGNVTGGLGAGDLTLNGQPVGATVDGVGTGRSRISAYAVAAAINLAAVPGLNATAATTLTGTVGGGGGIAAGAMEINGVPIGAINGATASAFAASAAAAISGAGAGVSASASGGTLTLTAADGADISFTGASLGLGNASLRKEVTITGVAAHDAKGLLVGGKSPGAAGFGAGLVAPQDTGQTVIVKRAVSSGDPPVDVSTAAAATAALDYLDGKLDDINALRAKLGATENRLTASQQDLQGGAINQAAARSRILDTDYASETMQLTRNQILQQAGMAMIAQAHSSPSQVLALLR